MTKHLSHTKRVQPLTSQGFSLIELLLAMSLGISLSGMILQLLISETSLGLRVNRWMRELNVQQRTLTLISGDVQRSSRISSSPQLEQHACSLAGRLPVLHLSTAAGSITYSVGDAPSSIWRGQVLMRCGPAFDLHGKPSLGSTMQNRVVIDALPVQPQPWTGCETAIGTESTTRASIVDLAKSSRKGFSACLDPQGLIVGLRLIQEFPGANHQNQNLISEGTAAAT
ncbi:MAG: prepilin-type N-terminal cleavage/methylation domain-containing protein [Synechococcaceae cyanobacterium]|nr:prepilin-type N-terminal cleavage/methylation domain-containing protein [Synechococcaceae cyanobacterium]